MIGKGWNGDFKKPKSRNVGNASMEVNANPETDKKHRAFCR
jgi:hypothetical protein